MEIKVLPVGLLETNCYLVHIPERRRVYVIDPGGDAAEILRAVRSFSFDSAAILLTHAHVDHISAAGEVAEKLRTDYVFLPEPDHELYRSPENMLPPYLPCAGNLPPATGRVPAADAVDFTVVALPGHTPGGCGFYFPGASPGPAFFVGDTIFAGSIGRTDFPGGDYETLQHSIRHGILTLPDEIVLYPGHGPATTVGRERRQNPYLQDER